MRLISKFLKDESGATAIEYGRYCDRHHHGRQRRRYRAERSMCDARGAADAPGDGAPYRLSAERGYVEIARPLDQREMKLQGLRVRDDGEDLYEAWNKIAPIAGQ